MARGLLRLYLLLQLCSGVYMTITETQEYKLRWMLRSTYDKTVRPVNSPHEAVNISFSLKLSKLVDVNLKQQVMKTDVWIVQEWMNPFMRWNESSFGGLHTLHVTTSDVWVPDIVLYNNGDDDEFLAGHTEKFKTNFIIESSGKTIWMSPATFKSSCDVIVTHFPFDSQICEMTFGSWTYDDRLLSIVQKEATHETSAKFVANGDWTINHVNISRQVKKYACCQYPFSDVTYVFILTRKPLYHMVYLVIPCLLISALILVNFLITPVSGERIDLCMTILLSMSVYHLILSSNLPETSEGIPLLGIYYMITMTQATAALIATALVLNCHNANGRPPNWLLSITEWKLKPSRRGNKVIDVQPPGGGNFGQTTNSATDNEIFKMETGLNVAVIEENNFCEKWREIARKLDKLFFSIFLIAFIVTTMSVFLSAPHIIDSNHWKNLAKYRKIS